MAPIDVRYGPKNPKEGVARHVSDVLESARSAEGNLAIAITFLDVQVRR